MQETNTPSLMADMTTLQSKVQSFSVDAVDAETQCADICREFKRLSTGTITSELEALSESFGSKVATLDDDPRQQKFTDIFDRIMFGIDFEYNIIEFIKVIDMYRARGCGSYIDQELKLMSYNLTFKSTRYETGNIDDIDYIVPMLRKTMERLTQICGNTELADGLKQMFKSTIKQYDSEHQLDASIAQLQHTIDIRNCSRIEKHN